MFFERDSLLEIQSFSWQINWSCSFSYFNTKAAWNENQEITSFEDEIIKNDDADNPQSRLKETESVDKRFTKDYKNRMKISARLSVLPGSTI